MTITRRHTLGLAAYTLTVAACSTTRQAASTQVPGPRPSSDLAELKLPTKAMPLNGILAQPAGQPKIAVILLHELFGLEPSVSRLAGRLRDAGYTALALNAYTTIPAPDPKVATSGPESFRNFPDDKYILAIRETVQWLRSGGSGVKHQAVYVWGFSMGGRFAHHAVALSDSVTGAINFYGRLNYPKMETKAFNCLDTAGLIDRPYLAMFGEGDPVAPEADIALLKSRMAGNPNASVQLLPGAKHSFFNDGSPAFDAGHAAKAWDAVRAFMEKYA